MLRKFTCSHMGFFGSLFLSILVSLHEVSQAIRSTSTIKEQLLKHGIMPDVMTFAPIKDIMVKYSDDAVANFGNKITTPKTQHEPYVQWSANPEHQYTLLMIDPDSPSRAHPADREWLHWLVVNINSFDVAHGDVLAEYIGPHPVQGSGYHRYVFIVLRQTTNQTIKFTEPYRSNTTMEGREKFSTRLFCDKYKYPNPWAVNFFHGEWFDAEQDKIDNDPGIVGSRTSKKRRMALYDHGIVQKKDGRLPPEDLTIEFKNGKIANYGNTLSPLQTQERPWVQWSAHPDHYYSLVMTVCLEAPMFVRLCAGEYFRGSYRVGFRFIRDWDAPNRKSHSMREWLHWMVVNIPSFNVPKGDTLTQYVGPHPKSNSGFHRYVFTIFTQKNITMRFNEPLRMRDEFETRPNFSTTGFAEKYNLGYPYAVNFIRVQYHGNYVNPFDDKVKIIDPDEIKLPL